jgi:hypothetical protein
MGKPWVMVSDMSIADAADWRGRSLVLLVVLTTACFAGCSGQPADVADVRGVVTLDGRPLEAATVQFQPAEGRASIGRTDSEGRYRLMYTPRELGARIGSCRVRISTAGDDDGKISPAERVPRRYFEPGALAAEVKAGGNVVDFHLETGP